MTEPAQVDVRDPQLRIERFLDSGTFAALTERDDSGMLAAHGTVSGTRVTIFATDATIQGGAMGEGGALSGEGAGKRSGGRNREGD